jgi:hypothetical protein
LRSSLALKAPASNDQTMTTGFRHPVAQAALALLVLFVARPVGRPALPRTPLPLAQRAQRPRLNRWLPCALALSWAAAPASTRTLSPNAERRAALVVGNASHGRSPLVKP